MPYLIVTYLAMNVIKFLLNIIFSRPNGDLVCLKFNFDCCTEELIYIICLTKLSGKAYYSNNQPPIELTEQNPLCRFKAIGYNCFLTTSDKDGLVQLLFNKPEQELKYVHVLIRS